MKFRAITGTELVVSEVGYSIGARSGLDPLLTERLVRLAYDEGINLFCLPVGPLHDAAVSSALGGAVRNKVFLSASFAWPADGDMKRLETAISSRLLRLNTDRFDILFLRNIPSDALADGAAADFVHRLGAGGRARCVGFSGAAGEAVQVRSAERAGAALIDFDADETTGELPRAVAAEFGHAGESSRISAVARFGPGFSSVASPSLSFLWNGTGRSAAQSLIALNLLNPWISSVSIAATSDEELRDVARTPLTPLLSERERAAIRAAERRPVLAEA